MIFGLRDAPEHFTRVMNNVLVDQPNASAYIDDVIVKSKNITAHIGNTVSLLETFVDFNVGISAEKCQWLGTSIKFLGCIINTKGISADPKKIAAIKCLPNPDTPKKLLSFIGVVNWVGKFLPNRHLLLAPLFDILKVAEQTQARRFTTEAMSNVKSLVQLVKDRLSTAVALAFPDLNRKFHVFTDASEIGISGALVQYEGNDPRVVDVFSRSLRPNEIKYTVFRKEILAILTAVTRWDRLLSNRKFFLRTDNKAATHSVTPQSIKSSKSNSTTTKVDECFLSKIHEYQFWVAHVSGVDNKLADYLSRYPQSVDDNADYDGDPVVVKPEADEQYAGAETKVGFSWISHQQQTMINYTVVEPDDEIKAVLVDEAHDGDHAGYEIMMSRIRAKNYDWPGLKSQCMQRAAVCRPCLAHNPARVFYHNPHTISATAPMQHCQADLAGPFPRSARGYVYVLVYTCCFTGYTIFTPLKTKTANAVADELVLIWCEYGAPHILQSDNGPEFSNQTLQDIVKIVKTEYRFSSQYNPRTNGRVESKVGQFKLLLRKLLENRQPGEKQNNWCQFLKFIQLMLNSRSNTLDKYSPFALMYGRSPDGIMGDDYSIEPFRRFAVTDWLRNQVVLQSDTHNEILEARDEAWDKRRTRFLKHNLVEDQVLLPGTLVMVKNPKEHPAVFEARWYGPYVVDSVNGYDSYTLKHSKDADDDRKLRGTYPRSRLRIISPDNYVGVDEPIRSFLGARVVKVEGLGDTIDSDEILVRYVDVSFPDEWVVRDSIRQALLDEFDANGGGVCPHHFSKNFIKNAYSTDSLDSIWDEAE